LSGGLQVETISTTFLKNFTIELWTLLDKAKPEIGV
jgi:hypothetical protein